jgi:hypothetical protein
MRFIFLSALLCAMYNARGGGIRGTVTADDGSTLAYATIYVKQTGTGVASDLQGFYEVTLPAGTYDVLFQFLGYETLSKKVSVGEGFTEINVTLKTQVMVLQNVTVSGKEDPAYTIMRKAIAKANYHRQQIDSYTARVYIKGKGQLKDYPWLAKKAIEKEGITKDRVFIQESVSDIKFTRPNKFEEKVIAIYTSGKEQGNSSPNAFVFGSFYEPEIAETVSPLSPKSFSYYRFEYLGTFRDRQYDISKIKVTPRSKGDNVVEGVLYLVEDWWSIHSLDFFVSKLGLTFKVKQIYNPIEDKAWLPVSQQFKLSGKVFGFEFEGDYLATMRDYKIKLNPALPQVMTVVDEKAEKEQARAVKKQHTAKKQQLQERLAAGQEITNKELKQLVKEYEKEEQKKQKEPAVIAETTFKIDSLARKKDSTFWADIRPIPLTKEEQRGYQVEDSLREVERKKNEGDTLRKAGKKNKVGFQPLDLITGDSYKVSPTSNFRIHPLEGGFNTVEGYNMVYRLSLYKRWSRRDTTGSSPSYRNSRFEISPIFRYAFGREKFSGKLRLDWRTRSNRFTVEGGRYIQQFNAAEPINPAVNGFISLLSGRNFMKIYERDFVDIRYRQQVNEKVTLRTYASWSQRTELFNTTSYTFFKRNRDRYTPNLPVNDELPLGGFETHQALIGSLGADLRPWQKFRIRNGRKYPISSSSPLITIDYRKGFSNTLRSDVDFDYLELGARHQIKLGIRGTLDVAVKAGKFLSSNQLYFMDFAHFLGNRTAFVTTDPIGTFRLLDYYRYSTADEFALVNAHYHFRKLLLSRIPKLRMLGISENIFVNYLAAPTAGHYTEAGYGIEGILRLFRLEAAAAFQQGDIANANYGFRIGLATRIGINFED